MATNDFSYDVDLITAVNKQDYFDNFKKVISTIP